MAKAPAPKYYEGQRFVNKQDPDAPPLVYSKGKFIPASEYIPPKQPGQIDPLTSAPSALVPMNLGFGPAVEAQKNLYKAQGWNTPKGYSNPITSSLGTVAAEVTKDLPVVGQFAPLMGDTRYREYLQSRKAMEAALLPIFSGAAVTPTEAMRQVSGNLPAASDVDPSVARRKTVNRSMMLNGIADMQGQPRPFPKVGALYPNPKQGQPGQPFVVNTPPSAVKSIKTEAEYEALAPGEAYIDPDGIKRKKK